MSADRVDLDELKALIDMATRSQHDGPQVIEARDMLSELYDDGRLASLLSEVEALRALVDFEARGHSFNAGRAAGRSEAREGIAAAISSDVPMYDGTIESAVRIGLMSWCAKVAREWDVTP